MLRASHYWSRCCQRSNKARAFSAAAAAAAASTLHAYGTLCGLRCFGSTPSSTSTSSIRAANALLLSKATTSTALTQDCLASAQGHEHLNAFITLTEEDALAEAVASDHRHSHGLQRGPLDGIPIAIKDNFCTRDVRTTAGSAILDDFVPPYDSTVASRLREAGAVLVGKTLLDEFGMGSHTMNDTYGVTINPWTSTEKSQRSAGGSSGGSAVAVATGSCFAAIGSDTGGSVRLPAAYCGVVGLKPSYGRVSRWGLISYASSLDCPSIMARTVADAYLVMRAIDGQDGKDSACTYRSIDADDFDDAHVRSTPDSQEKDMRRVKIGIPIEFYTSDLPETVLQMWTTAIEWYQDAGAEVYMMSLPSLRVALPAYYVLAVAEASSNLARYDGLRFGALGDMSPEVLRSMSLKDLVTRNRSGLFGDEVKRRICAGSFVLSSSEYASYVLKAQKIRRELVSDFSVAFDKADFLLLPTAASSAPLIADCISLAHDSPADSYLTDILTVPANLAGLPSVSIPVHRDANGMPLGMQLMAKPFSEAALVSAAMVMERRSSFLCVSEE
jgi:aspartyl-tRNA(Asn)/glutamyl-tRNA(Gln) amidotransferase subunit A